MAKNAKATESAAAAPAEKDMEGFQETCQACLNYRDGFTPTALCGHVKSAV